jgi:cell division septation protein DedD
VTVTPAGDGGPGATGAAAAGAGAVDRTGSAWIAGGRLCLVLGWPQLALAVIALLLLMVLAYEIGRRSVHAPAAKPADLKDILGTVTESEAPRTEAAAPTPARGGAGGPVATPGGPARGEEGTPAKPTVPPSAASPPKEAEAGDTFAFASGEYYVVVQHFRTRDRDRAVAAKEFLRSKGVNCAIRPGSGDLELVATEAFSSEQQAQGLVRRILELGKEYWNTGGGYEFTGAKARKF